MTTGGNSAPESRGKGWFRPLLRLTSGLATLLDWSGRLIAVGCLGFLFVALLVNVILRYMFGSGLAWAYEIHALLLPWLVAGGIVLAASRGRNIAITLLPEALGEQRRRYLLMAIEVTVLIIAISVLWSSPPILKAAKFQTLSTLGIKQVWGYASLIFAFAAIALIAVRDLLRLLSGEDVMDHDLTHASLS